MATYMIDGRLTKDAEIVSTKKGDMLRFSIAWNRNKGVHYYNCSMFSERGTKLLPYMKKGKYLIIVGEPDWNDYNGKTYETIIVDKLNFVGGRSEETPQQSGPFTDATGKTYESEQAFNDSLAAEAFGNRGPESFDDSDIPF